MSILVCEDHTEWDAYSSIGRKYVEKARIIVILSLEKKHLKIKCTRTVDLAAIELMCDAMFNSLSTVTPKLRLSLPDLTRFRELDLVHCDLRSAWLI
jgi:hypothetical protein